MNDRNLLPTKNIEIEGERRRDGINKKYGTTRYLLKEIEQTKIFHGEDEDIIFNINSNPNNIKKDLLFFKDEILK